jgi:hypothetical protein
MATREAEVSATARINAPPERIYRLIADYRNGHPRILPPQLRNLVVEQGGIGAGTVFTCEMRAFGTTGKFRAAVTEPHPGRVLIETLDDGKTVTTFTVEPADRGHAAQVTIHTRTIPRSGILGIIERALSTRFLRSVYEKELKQLEKVVKEEGN